MAGFKLTVGFLFVLVCFASVSSVNGSCSSNSQCSPGFCIRNRCLCPEGYSEPNCAAGTGCSLTCQNGGVCYRSSSSYTPYCLCPTGYSGYYCQNSVRTCSPACQNGGTCHVSSSSAHCNCPSGYSGSYCQTRVTCTPACRNGGTCHVSSSSAHCDCPSGYTGSYCEYSGRACNPSCQNGGSCIAGSCVCPHGYNGSYCQHSSFNNFCSPSCENGGTCGSNGVCHCPSGYGGSHCQHSSFSSSGGSTGIVVGGVFGGIVFISCIVGITLLRVCLRVATIQRRTRNIEATQVPSPGTGRRVILLRRVCRVPVTNPDAPPPYVPSADMQSSDPPPYTTNSANCPLHISVEDTPTPQPLPPEAPPSNPIEDPPENLPPLGRDQDREPLLANEQ